ncbi:MAG: VWA domain-containing protein [Gammaproteobacteria bacterium]|nr:VWA domain-containing protein [Gammaproteobacteria bacterium]
MISLWQQMSFREPLWLLLILQPILLMVLAGLLDRWRASGFCDASLLPWVRADVTGFNLHRFIRSGLFLLAWIFVAIAMAGPRLPETLADHSTTTQRELIVLLDVSPSMTARDVQPNRLQRAKLELLDLIQRIQGTRMGIIVYGAQAHIVSPMTRDKTVLRHYVNAIHPQTLPTAGSRIIRAIELARTQFDTNNKQARALLIISDGEHHLDNSSQLKLEAHVQQLNKANIRLYALGIGTGLGAPVMADDQGWLEYEGQSITSRLQSQQLQALTQLARGRYSRLQNNNSDWQTLYDEGIGQLFPVTQQQVTDKIIWQDHYHGFLIAGIICLLLSLWQPWTRVTALPILILAVITSLLNSHDVLASDNYQTAYEYLQQQQYSKARQTFTRLPGYAARMGEGNAAYHLKDYKQAAQQFTQALLDAVNDQQRGMALFNLANCRFQLSDYVTAENLYQDVLHYLPAYQPAKSNREFAKALQVKAIKSGRTAHRAGRGPQTGDAPEGMSTEGVRGLTLGEDDQQKIILTDNKASTLHQAQKLQQARAASTHIDSDKDSDWQYRINSLEQLQQENPTIEASHSFWQRLFEQEEGFSAPLEQPQQLPGVKPW